MANPSRTLDSLPDELLELVVQELDMKDLKSLRSTCHNLNSVSTAPLFQKIVLLPIRGCLEGFASLLNTSPHLAAYVKTVHYNEVWQTYLQTQPEMEKMSEVQEELLDGSRNWRTQTMLLRTVFRSLPDLREVYVYGLRCKNEC